MINEKFQHVWDQTHTPYTKKWDGQFCTQWSKSAVLFCSHIHGTPSLISRVLIEYIQKEDQCMDSSDDLD